GAPLTGRLTTTRAVTPSGSVGTVLACHRSVHSVVLSCDAKPFAVPVEYAACIPALSRTGQYLHEFLVLVRILVRAEHSLPESGHTLTPYWSEVVAQCETPTLAPTDLISCTRRQSGNSQDVIRHASTPVSFQLRRHT